MSVLGVLHTINGYWKVVQRILDVDGDTVMLGYTIAIVYKTLHGGLNGADAAAYATAVGAFGYSKRNEK